MNRSVRTEIHVPFRTILILAGVFLLGWALVSIRDALLIVFLGIFIGLVLEQPVRMVERRLRLSRGLSATIVVLSGLIGLTLLGLVLLVPFVEALRDFLQSLPTIVEDLRDSDTLGWAGDGQAAGNVQDGADAVASSIPDAVSSVIGLAGEAFGVFIVVFTVTFTALFFLTDSSRLREAAASVMPPDEATRWAAVWERITVTVSRWAVGVVIIGAIAGTVQGVTAYLLGSSFALALGLLAGFLDTIPNLGATIAGFLLSLTLLAEEGLTAALIMLAVVLIYQQVENNLLTPSIQGRATNISGFLVIVAVTVFGALLGVLGALVAVPVAATIQIIIIEVTAARRERLDTLRAAAAGGTGGGPAAAAAGDPA